MALSKLHFQLHSFAELDAADLYQIMQLRSEVFVLEQNCAYQDLDGLDQKALHLYGKIDSCQFIAYARILKPEQCEFNHCSIGRVVVAKAHRNGNLGRALMQAAIEVTRKQFPELAVRISAQTYLTQFYQQLGFVNTGHYYLEDQISHQEMIYQPK